MKAECRNQCGRQNNDSALVSDSVQLPTKRAAVSLEQDTLQHDAAPDGEPFDGLDVETGRGDAEKISTLIGKLMILVDGVNWMTRCCPI